MADRIHAPKHTLKHLGGKAALIAGPFFVFHSKETPLQVSNVAHNEKRGYITADHYSLTQSKFPPLFSLFFIELHFFPPVNFFQIDCIYFHLKILLTVYRQLHVQPKPKTE